MSSTLTPGRDATTLEPMRGLDRIARRAMLGRLDGLHDGVLSVREGATEHRFGGPARDGLRAALEVRDPRFWSNAAFGGTVGAGESYILGHWESEDLTSLVRLMVRNRGLTSRVEGGLARLANALRRLWHHSRRNTRAGSQRNIAAHYDLGNAFFKLMLDPTMAYSCAIYPAADAGLHAAQLHKFETICRTLDLRPGERLLEIGTGWGGLAMHAARHHGCEVTTTTISAEQHAFAAAAIEREGLGGRVRLLREDYRDLRGRYDKLVSVEMIEAVGHRYLDDYFASCGRLLEPHGAMLLQAITIQDQLYAEALRSVDFIQRFVFPGGFIPSVSAIVDAARRVTDLKLFHLVDIGPHYATTLADWRRNVHAHVAEIRALGYPESFLRLWDFYLAYCEGGFLERQLGDVQMLLTKPGCRRAPLAP